MNPFFSIIIPLYNKEDYIEATLKSVLNQSFKDFEIIIVDDGSTDSSLKVISKIEDERLILLKQKNLGVSMARNNGITKSKGKYIALLDADDIWLKNHLFELKKLIQKFPKAGLYCNNYEIYYSDTLSFPANFNFLFNEDCLIVDDYFEASIINAVAWTSAVGFTKEKFNSVGGFDAKLITTQDTDLWIKMALKYDVVFNPKMTAYYKFYIKDSLSKSKYIDIRYKFIQNFSEEEKTNPSLKKYLDINRYSLAIRCKLVGDKEIFGKLKSKIDNSNLNIKQKFLLNCPKPVLNLFKYLQKILVRSGYYTSANI